MQKSLRVALCQLNTTVGDLHGNAAKILSWYRQAVRQGADLVAFPELTLTGYPPRDLLDMPDFLDKVAEVEAQITSASGEAGLVFGTLRANSGQPGKRLMNAAVLCHRGKTLDVVLKKLLPTYDVFDEGRYFEPDTRPAQPVVFRDHRIGLHICEDAWNEKGFWDHRLYGRDPVKELGQQGVDFFLNISASPFHGDKGVVRRSMFASHVESNGRPFLYTNLVGGNDELIFDGEAFVFEADGNLVSAGDAFSEEILLVDVAGDHCSFQGAWFPEQPDTVRNKNFPEELTPTEANYEALVLGLRDYAAKCGFKTAVLGLSGGIDSAVTAVLAKEAFGPKNVWGVALPSRYSSQGSLDDAEALATNLGIRFDTISIEPIFSGALNSLESTFAGTEPGVAEENLQARARGNLLMALSNKFGHLLLTTGNKSELATGYCTLYGDMCGGLAVISDVPKLEVYNLANWMNREREIVPQNTITKPPSAELRPDQTDQDSLPPYDELDAILEGHVEKLMGHDALVAAGFDEAIVKRVLGLVARAEYKRRQAAPGLRISPKAFGTGRRMPIATPWPI